MFICDCYIASIDKTGRHVLPCPSDLRLVFSTWPTLDGHIVMCELLLSFVYKHCLKMNKVCDDIITSVCYNNYQLCVGAK